MFNHLPTGDLDFATIHRYPSYVFPYFPMILVIFQGFPHMFLWFSVWWFGTCFIFPYIGNSNPNWLYIYFFQRGWNHQPVFHLLMGFPIAMFEDPVLRGALPPSPRLGCYGFGTPACVDENLMPQLLNCNWVLKWWYHTGWPPPVTLW